MRSALSLCLLALAVGVLAAPAGAGEARQAKAVLHVVRLKPLTVRGVGFKADEKVVLRLTGAGTATATAKATAAGTVTLTLPKAALTACSPYVLRATGLSGTTATLKNVVGAACKPVATVDFGASVIVIGSHFQPGERLTVTLVADGTRTKPATVNAKGSFQASFGALALSNCSAYTLKITGSKGSKFTKTQPAVPC
ncbi:MAG: hypothetical protein ACJ77E_04510 [Gaiellaceae bacterium]